MTDFWQRIAIAIPVIIGIYTLFLPTMLLGALGDLWVKRFPDLIHKPLFSCPPCMSSVHGFWLWLALGGSVEPMLIIFCLALCGILKTIAHNLL